MDAPAPHSGFGREARGVQASAPGRRVTTEESEVDHDRCSFPPATTNACRFERCVFTVVSHPCGRKSSTDVTLSVLRQLWKLLHKTVDVVPLLVDTRIWAFEILHHYQTFNVIKEHGQT